LRWAAKKCAVSAIKCGDDVDYFPSLSRLLGELGSERLGAGIERIKRHVFVHGLQASAGHNE
jgi:hypothetical protein